jgi:hypothetical protein
VGAVARDLDLAEEASGATGAPGHAPVTLSVATAATTAPVRSPLSHCDVGWHDITTVSTPPPSGWLDECEALGAERPLVQSFPNRHVSLGPLTVARALPVREKRLVGPWCFLDRFGPLSFGEGKPMDVAPHPHIGLQTVTWLLDGEVVHDDSLGSESLLRPGGTNVMTSGRGIAHAEQTPSRHSGRLDGVQLWVALPENDRDTDPGFSHLDIVPMLEQRGGITRVFSGHLLDAASSAPHYSDLLGADLEVHAGGTLSLPLEPRFEHALLLLRGDCRIEDTDVEGHVLYYLGTARSGVDVSSREGCRVLLVGGPPFPESIVMWWNFVARTPEEIARAREDWEAGRRFGDVPAYRGARLAAPPLTRLARAAPMI